MCSEPGQERSQQEWMTALHTGYQQSALNCWIAALLYLVTLAFSGHQLWANHQNQEQFKVLSSVICSLFSASSVGIVLLKSPIIALYILHPAQ